MNEESRRVSPVNYDDIVPLEKKSDGLPAVREDGGVVVSLQPEGLVIGGDPVEVESYLSRIRKAAGDLVRVAGIDKSSLGNATGLLAEVASLLGQSGTFVQLHPDSVKAIQAGNLIPGTDGFFRMTTRGADGQFLQQLQWAPTNINPAELVSVQMIAVQLALKSAIAQVEDAVRRVEGKVEAVLQLALAGRAGDVIGDNRTVSRMVTYLERHGRLTDADWNAVAGVGHAVVRTVEQLRNHVTLTLKGFDPEADIHRRSHIVRLAVDEKLLGETLALLIVAEDSLYKWQRLRVARVEAVEPEHLKHVIEDARELVVNQLKEDAALYQKTKESLGKMKKTEAIDGLWGLWYESVSNLGRDTDTLQRHVDQFAKARGVQVSEWTRFEDRSFLDGAGAALDIATKKASRVLAATGEGIVQAGNAAKPALDIAAETASRALVAAGDGITQVGNFFTGGQPQKGAITKDEPVKQNGQTE
jgi:hypothetical protein